MRALIILFLLIAIGCKNREQVAEKNQCSKFSASARIFLKELAKQPKNKGVYQLQKSLIDEYNIADYNSAYYVDVLIHVSEEVEENELKALGMIIGSKVGKVWTGKVPLSRVTLMCNLSDIQYVSIYKSTQLKN